MSLVTITGATGLLGGNLATALREAGHTVRCTRRATSKAGHLAHLDLEWVEADLGAPEMLRRAFDGADAVFHCVGAFSLSPRDAPMLRRVNVEGTEAVADAARQASVGRLVHVSSTAAVGLSVDGETPCDETAPYNFADYGLDDAYSRSKRDAEARVRAAIEAGLDAVIVNPGNMYGPLDVGPSSGQMILDVVRGDLPALTPGRNCFTDARAVARGMIAAWEKGRTGERYILGGQNRSYAEMARAIADIASVRPPRLTLPHPVARLVGAAADVATRLTGRPMPVSRNAVAWGYCRRFIFSSAKAVAELGYDPVSPDEGVRAALAWFRENGRL